MRRSASVLGCLGAALWLVACGSSGHPAARASPTVSASGPSPSGYVPPAAGIAAIQLFHPMSQYTAYVQAKLAAIRPQLAELTRAIDAGDLPAAQRAWLSAYLTWLEIGQDDGQYGAFGTLGGEIDGLAEGDVGGTASPRFTGFHRVEDDLFDRHDLVAARADAHRLVALVESIGPTTLASDLSLRSVSLDAWVLRTHEILEDGLRDSLDQNDDYGSNSDLDSIHADVSATREMLAVLSGLIVPRAPELMPSAERELDAIDAALQSAPRDAEPDELPLRTRQRIDGDVGAALETLAPVSELMQISNSGS